MSDERQMKRGKVQSLYKYLPDEWIDFSVRGKYRRQYIAKVLRWNSEKVTDINQARLIRIVDGNINAFRKLGQDPRVPSVIGFPEHLTVENCAVLTPRVSDKERGIVAQISPLTFYCPKCYQVYQYKKESQIGNCKCSKCSTTLSQFRQIYFCKCGYATDKHPVSCKKHGYDSIKWDGKYTFHCTQCNEKIPMQAKCKVCGNLLLPKVALDQSQYFPFTTNMIDLIDKKLEDFVANTDYGKYITFAFWENKITREQFEEVITNGINNDPDEYNKAFQKCYDIFKTQLPDEQAKHFAKLTADQQCNTGYNLIVDEIKGILCATEKNINTNAEQILEYDKVKSLKNSVDLGKAIDVAKLLNTQAKPEIYKEIAERFGVNWIQACDKIPFVSSTYGYTRVKSEYEAGVQLHGYETDGQHNIFAAKMDTEGVLFEFDRVKILRWLLENQVITEEELPNLENEAEVKMWFVNNIQPDAIHTFNNIDITEAKITKYVYGLIHTLSHLLLRAAASIGGLGKDSLSEYIFPCVPAVLIYCQNSQGFSLGSLTNTFEASFDRWMNTAYNIAQKCLFDPICIERHKACSGCLYINEISCVHFNKDLDRSLVIGHMDKVTHKVVKGFWEE